MRKSKRYIKDIQLINNYGEFAGYKMRGNLVSLIEAELTDHNVDIVNDGYTLEYNITGRNSTLVLKPHIDNIECRVQYHRPHTNPQRPRYIQKNYDKAIKKWLRANKRWLL